MGKVLIVYYSRADENYFPGEYKYIDVGNTERVVNMITEMIDADVFRIKMKTPYAADYQTCIAQAKADLKADARPELDFMPSNLVAYSSVILAYPNFWGTIPMPLASFLVNYSWRGKNILPVCTHEGGGMGTSERKILQL